MISEMVSEAKLLDNKTAWILTKEFNGYIAKCPYCGYKEFLYGSYEIAAHAFVVQPVKDVCPKCLKAMKNSDEDSKHNSVDETQPKILNIDSETTTLNNKINLDISSNLSTLNLESLDKIIINGITFVREKIDE
jgi:predicted  nucleic acid-binding Zn-ribbon protein